jgi:outer membrane lipoprotein LolB
VFRFTHAIAAAALLGACATIPETAPLPPGEFELSGRVAVRSGKEAVSGRVFWRHSDEADDLIITSPIGQGIAHLSRERDVFRLVTADQREYSAADAETLTEGALGWRLPLKGLPDWVQGRASPGRSAEVRYDAEQRLLELLQDGWRIDYEAFRDARPARLRISRDDLQIRLTVDEWAR